LSSKHELVVLLGDREVGRLMRDRGGRACFAYADDWRHARRAYPLSLSMPLAGAEHRARVVEPFLWGLLPDNEMILERWGKRFHVSPRNASALLAHVGEDCAGALRIVPPERVDESRDGGIEWLDEADVAARLRELADDASAWRRATDEGQFSLAGAQPKVALWWDGDRWGLPRGATATTHILKPGIAGRDGQALNEHFCMALAREAGLAVARSEVTRFEDQVVIALERYDRLWRDGEVLRVHQEDLCQALAVHPANKYESDGGPGASAIVDLLRDHSQRVMEDVTAFVDALAFNWLIAGTDAHAKNYSILIGAGGAARLAPLYDVASLLPYPDFNPHKTRLAMRIGDKYRLRDIDAHAWAKLTKQLRLDGPWWRDRLRDMARALPDRVACVERQCRNAGVTHPILGALAEALRQRAASCTRELA
jgi:serine/threonine-protein kinase HipA